MAGIDPAILFGDDTLWNNVVIISSLVAVRLAVWWASAWRNGRMAVSFCWKRASQTKAMHRQLTSNGLTNKLPPMTGASPPPLCRRVRLNSGKPVQNSWAAVPITMIALLFSLLKQILQNGIGSVPAVGVLRPCSRCGTVYVNA